MLLGLVVCVIFLMNIMQLSFSETLSALHEKGYTKIFNTDVNSPSFLLKQIIGRAFITIAMTGLDQEMMQKNISVRTLHDSQKNMLTFSVIIVLVNFLFLFLGGLLYLFASKQGLAVTGDDLFPTVALQHMPQFISIIFIIGLISALFPSADGAITALTSSFCIDILGLKRNKTMSDAAKMRLRKVVHLTFAVVFMICVIGFKIIDNKSIITVILKVAGYTYGPLLGLFAFGIFSNRKVKESLVPLVCLLAPLVCYLIEINQASVLGKFQIGIELLLLNGLLTAIGLFLISVPAQRIEQTSITD
jgi:Na+/proline symporter